MESTHALSWKMKNHYYSIKKTFNKESLKIEKLLEIVMLLLFGFI